MDLMAVICLLVGSSHDQLSNTMERRVHCHASAEADALTEPSVLQRPHSNKTCISISTSTSNSKRNSNSNTFSDCVSENDIDSEYFQKYGLSSYKVIS